MESLFKKISMEENTVEIEAEENLDHNINDSKNEAHINERTKIDLEKRNAESAESLNVDNHNSKDDEPLIINTVDITPEKSGGVLKQIFKDGDEDEYPEYGDRIIVRYKGWLLDNKEKPTLFDITPEGETCEFNLGRGMVIKGWDLGISTMKKGEVAVFIIQPEYAYGLMGNPPRIPAYTPLLFEIELHGWKLDDLSPKKDNSILRKVIEQGEGSAFPNEGAKVKVKLVGYLNGDVFENREVGFILGEGCNENIPEGLEIALYRFHLNEKSLIYLKNKYVLDIKVDLNSILPPEKDVKYEISLTNFEKAKNIWEMNPDEKLEKAEISKEKGVNYFKAGNYKVALRQFKWILTCLEKEPGVPEGSEETRKSLLLSGFLNIALCLLKLEHFVEAVKMSNKALEIDAKNEKALFRRGQARMAINDCEEALQDFQILCSINPENKAVKNSILLCHERIKKQKMLDKSTYNQMFEKFVKQDEERRRNAGTETGVWQNEKREVKRTHMTETERLIERNNSALRDANIIELSNTAC